MTDWEVSDLSEAQRSGDRGAMESAPAARRSHRYGLPVARLGVSVWPDGDRTLYAKGEHGDEHPVSSFDEVPYYIRRLFDGLDISSWANGDGDITLHDDGSVTRKRHPRTQGA